MQREVALNERVKGVGRRRAFLSGLEAIRSKRFAMEERTFVRTRQSILFVRLDKSDGSRMHGRSCISSVSSASETK